MIESHRLASLVRTVAVALLVLSTGGRTDVVVIGLVVLGLGSFGPNVGVVPVRGFAPTALVAMCSLGIGLPSLALDGRPQWLVLLGLGMIGWLGRSAIFWQTCFLPTILFVSAQVHRVEAVVDAGRGFDLRLVIASFVVGVASVVLGEFLPEPPSDHVEYFAGHRGPLRRPLRALGPSVGTIFLVAAMAFVIAPQLPDIDIEPPQGLGEWGPGNGGGGTAAPHPGLNGRLDAGDTPTLSDEIVLRVEADVPLYWRGVTYDRYDGRYWESTFEVGPAQMPADGVYLSAPSSDPRAIDVRQQFTLEMGGLDVFVGASRMNTLWYDGFDAEWSSIDDSIQLDEGLPAGTQWVVDSQIVPSTPDVLRAADASSAGTPDWIIDAYTSTEGVSPAVASLAAEITAGTSTRYDAVAALEIWFDENVTYSRDVPTVDRGEDPVDRLLFDIRTGYCEQIATSMILMLRSLDIPARMAVGYVPGEQDPETGEWISRGRDAHAWTEVYFAGIGWHAFDPTSGVPLSGEFVPPEPEPLRVNWGLVVMLMLGTLVLSATTFGVTKLVERRRRDPIEVRFEKIAALLDLDWPVSTTVEERFFDLERAGVDEATLMHARSVLHAQFAPSPPTTDEVDRALEHVQKAVAERRSELVGSSS